jgi:hypothetical protein
MFDFKVTVKTADSIEERAFQSAGKNFAVAVHHALKVMQEDHPTATFSRLTFFHPPLD